MKSVFRAIESRLQYAEPHYKAMALMMVLGHPAYFVLWKYIFPQPYESFALRAVMAVFSIPFLAHNGFPQRWLRYRAAYVYVAFTVELPFFFTFMAGMNGFNLVWALSHLAALFTVLMVFEATEAVIAICIGMAAAFAVLQFFPAPPMPHVLSGELLGIWVFSVVVGYVFNISRSIERAQQRFFALMGHELRTPLNAIVGASALLREDAMPERERELLRLVRSNAAILGSRVNHVLDGASLDADRLKLEREVFSVGSIVEAIRMIGQPLADEKGVLLSLDDGGESGTLLRGDALRIEQVVTNLVSNAIKYTPRGGRVDFRVMIAPGRGGQGCTLVFRVIDTGVGIPDADKQRVFDPFYRVSANTSQPGTGLGLYIVKRLSDRMGGELEVTDNPSSDKTGTVFVWRLPADRALESAASDYASKAIDPLAELAAHRARSGVLRCLIVDDTANNRFILARMLELGGHRVAEENSGDDALERLHREQFDVVFLDMHMPGLSGLEVVTRLSRSTVPAVQQLHVVITTADPGAHAAFADNLPLNIEFMPKPINVGVLLHCLDAVLTREGIVPEPGRGDSTAATVPAAMRAAPIGFVRASSGAAGLRMFQNACSVGIDRQVRGLDVAVREERIPLIRAHVHGLQNEFLNAGYSIGAEWCQATLALIAAGRSIDGLWEGAVGHAAAAKALLWRDAG